MMLSLLLFWLFFKIGWVSFGGAYSVWALVYQVFVEASPSRFGVQLEPLAPELFYQFMEVGQLTPGPTVNGVLLVGHHYDGLVGIGIALLGLLLPSILLIILLYKLNQRWGLSRHFHMFKTGALAAVIGILVFFFVQFGEKIPRTSLWQTLLFIAQILAVLYFIHVRRLNVILVTALSGVLTWAYSYWFLG